MKVFLPPFVKVQAEAFADSEAKKGSPAWDKAFNRYCQELYAYSATPAANPAAAEHDVLVKTFGEIFDKFSSKKKDKKNNEKRLLGIIANLTNLFLELEVGMKVHADRDANIEDDSQLSSFQMPKMKGLSKDQSEALQKKKVLNRYIRLLVSTVIAESLIPFMKMDAKDLQDVLDRSGFEENPANELKKSENLMSFALAVRESLDHVFGNVDLKAMILKKQLWTVKKKVSSAV